MIAARILAVLAAAAFVSAFAVATLFPALSTLAQLVARDDPKVLVSLHDFVVARGPAWVWNDLALPLLLRPAWLVPVCIGVLCAGGATTLASRASVPRSHRRRS